MPSLGIGSYFWVAYMECELLEAQSIDKTHLGMRKPLQKAPWTQQVCPQHLKKHKHILHVQCDILLLVKLFIIAFFMSVTDGSYDLSKIEWEI